MERNVVVLHQNIWSTVSFFSAVRFHSFMGLASMFSRKKVPPSIFEYHACIHGLDPIICFLSKPLFNSGRTVTKPNCFSAILTGIGGACTTSAVSILLLIVLDSTKTTLGPSQFTRLPVFLGITVTNVTYLIISDLIVWFEPKAKPMIIACQVSFSLWGLFITVGYLAAGARIRRNLSASHRMSSYNRCFREQSKGLQSLLRLLYACAVVGVLYFVLSIYSATNNDFGVSNGSAYVKREWDWLGLQTSSRILEISLSVLMLVITTRSLRNEPEDRYVIERTACKTSKRNACSLETRTSHLNREPSLITDLPKFQQVSYV